jgi:hypothetical protein
MTKILTFPFRLLGRLLLLPFKILFASIGLTFLALFKAGTLPLKGGVFAGRKLGLKALILFAAGTALGVVVGRRLADQRAEGAGSAYPGGFGAAERPDAGPVAVATMVEDTLEVVDTPDGPVVALVEDTIEVVETRDGELVTETVTITEVGSMSAEDEATAELDDEVEAEIDQALGFTAGELGVDTDADPAAGAS